MKWEVLSDNGKTHGDDEPEEGVGQDPPSDAEEPKEPSSEEDVSSEDEYVDDYRKAKQNQRSVRVAQLLRGSLANLIINSALAESKHVSPLSHAVHLQNLLLVDAGRVTFRLSLVVDRNS